LNFCRFLVLPLLLAGGCGRPAGIESADSVAPQKPTTILTKSGIEMVFIPAGEFLMGDEGGDDDEKPVHRVRLSAFAMDISEVTQEAFKAMLGRNPAKWPGPGKPVERISWFSAIQYCNMRSTREGFKPCYDLKTMKCDFTADGYHLPTEAQWEYACRAGTAGRWSFGDDASELGKYAWFKGNAAKTTHAVKLKRPNPWGLFDMHGGVAEWCNDFYAEHYDAGQPQQDPQGPASGQQRVLRGGSWASDEDACRSAARNKESPGLADVCFGYEAYGFRCVRQAQPADKHAKEPQNNRSPSPSGRGPG
jgi:formylglycine-generating enzyme required for sulfatase activity